MPKIYNYLDNIISKRIRTLNRNNILENYYINALTTVKVYPKL